jgi:hypothetical protein
MASDPKGGIVLFAVGGTMLLWAYFYGLSTMADSDIISQALDYIFAFVALYLIGYGLWMIIRSALDVQTKT